MFRPSSSRFFILFALVVCLHVNAARAGVILGELANKIEVPLLRASFDGSTGDLEVAGNASLKSIAGMPMLYRFHLDANFGADGTFNSAQKGSFSITNGSVVLLKGTITEARGSVFGRRRSLEFLADTDIGGSLASLYQQRVGLKLSLLPVGASSSRILASGFSFSPSFMAVGTAEIGRAVPEPTSLAAMTSIFLLGGGFFRRRRRSLAA